jgi:hypothetical protein
VVPFVQIVDGATPQNLLHAVLWHEGGTRLLHQEEFPDAKNLLHHSEGECS